MLTRRSSCYLDVSIWTSSPYQPSLLNKLLETPLQMCHPCSVIRPLQIHSDGSSLILLVCPSSVTSNAERLGIRMPHHPIWEISYSLRINWRPLILAEGRLQSLSMNLSAIPLHRDTGWSGVEIIKFKPASLLGHYRQSLWDTGKPRLRSSISNHT